jgi:hypothetical protein
MSSDKLGERCGNAVRNTGKVGPQKQKSRLAAALLAACKPVFGL